MKSLFNFLFNCYLFQFDYRYINNIDNFYYYQNSTKICISIFVLTILIYWYMTLVDLILFIIKTIKNIKKFNYFYINYENNYNNIW